MHTQPKRIDAADVAKIIKTTLRKHYPSTSFSVRTSRYSGGSSIDVHWTDGPTQPAVKEIIGHFHGATFDGMQDLKEYHNSMYNGELVSFGNDYLSLERRMSDARLLEAVEWYRQTYTDPAPVTFHPTKISGRITCTAWISTDIDTERIIMHHAREQSY